ncbi:MAG: GNAT family N-acetyltransferase [Eubacteriales bacterium]
MLLDQATPADLPAVAALVNSAYRGDSSRQGWTTEADYLGGQRTDAETLAADLAAIPGARVMLLRDEQDLLATVWLEPKTPTTWYLGMLTVRPSLQDRGSGRSLLAGAEDLARTAGVQLMQMTVVLSATQIFKLVIDSQRNALATQNVQESLKYFLEVTAKEMRMAQKSNGVCPGISSGQIFVVTSNAYGNSLSFKNYYGECVTYAVTLDGTTPRFRITRNAASDFISPAKISIDALNFVLADDAQTQPTITINIKAHALNSAQFKSEMVIQSSIASRYYK